MCSFPVFVNILAADYGSMDDFSFHWAMLDGGGTVQ
jgi:hypothetical protein